LPVKTFSLWYALISYALMIGLTGCAGSTADRDKLAAQGLIQESAPVKAAAEIIIAVPETKVWNLLTDIKDWPKWQPGSMRFVVPIRTVYSAPNPKYFGRLWGMTWYNLLSDRITGLNAIPVPGTMGDSLVLLAVVLEQQTKMKPTRIMTDTGAHTGVMFGLFRLLGHRFCPLLADIGGTRFWRIDPRADYGKLNAIAQYQLKLRRIAPHWDDMLRLSGSLQQGQVPATDITRTLQVGDNPTQLAQAIAEFGRID
jgi:TnpA family transposase